MLLIPVLYLAVGPCFRMPEFLSSLLQMGSVVNMGIAVAIEFVIIDVVLTMTGNNVVDKVSITLRTALRTAYTHNLSKIWFSLETLISVHRAMLAVRKRRE